MKSKTVVIEVNNGTASVAVKSKGIRLIIRDNDKWKESEGSTELYPSKMEIKK